jgi:hypothetical protein
MEEGRAAPRREVMRLQPFQIVSICVALFWAGAILALMLFHGQAQPPEYAPFQAPF